MLKRLMVLGGMLAMLLVVAAPAMAQADEYMHSGTGLLGEPYTEGQGPERIYPLTDEATGTSYELVSGFVALEDYVGQRVTFEGQQVPGLPPGPGEPIPVNVTSLEPVNGGPAAPEIVTVGGTLEAVAEPLAEGPTHTITEDSPGDTYGLFSDAQGVDLSQYEGQKVTIYGIFQTAGAPISDFADPTDVLIYVTAVEPAAPLPVGPTTEIPEDVVGGGTTVVASPVTGESVLPNTGGFSAVTLGLVSVALLGGFGLLAYGYVRQR